MKAIRLRKLNKREESNQMMLNLIENYQLIP